MRKAGWIPIVLLCLSPGLARAQAAPVPSESYTAAINAVLDRAIEEQRVLINCAATMPSTSMTVQQDWFDALVKTGARLTELGFGFSFINDFAVRAAPGALMMSDEPFSKVVAFCASHSDWERQMYQLTYTLLPQALDEVPVESEIAEPETGPEIGPSGGKLENAH